MMRVNKAITRLANKKQMETDNLYMLFVFCVMRMRRTICYRNVTTDIQAVAIGHCDKSHLLHLGLHACFLRLFGANVLARLVGFSPGRALACLPVRAFVCTAPAREQFS